ncbi:VOC family protein [Streptomyces zagrosensis]|uniref:Glyoxalase-like domain-containing protein n=1 Tax=Streptomyces zagrosensis TaxID=1042984 RepID=A0A7W9Q9M9_9ACTN|nr:VOC family protein [Streptomyces zagrosensis]MBB5935047.1 hypothetical protein [Streptomyces zagrosensis]
MGYVRIGVLVLDCVEPRELADFYLAVLDGEVCPGADSDRIDVTGAHGLRMGFRRDLHAIAPSWPRPETSQQAHLELVVDEQDMDAAERQLIGLGARPLETREKTGPHEIRLYADPAGHPFALRCSTSSRPKIG